MVCRGPDGKDSWLPAHDSLAKKWTMPFVMQPINTRVVRRSNALLGDMYGESGTSLLWDQSLYFSSLSLSNELVPCCARSFARCVSVLQCPFATLFYSMLQ